MKKKLKIIIAPAALLVFIAAIVLLHHELKNLSYTEIINTLKAIPYVRIFAAMCLALTYYILLGGYDIVAFKYINPNAPVKPKDILFTCFISNILGNNTGYSMLFGGSIRYRLYSFHNVSMLDVTKVLFFSSATIWLGLLAIGGIFFTFTPVSLAGITKFDISTRPIGIIFLTVLIAYILVGIFQSKPLKIFKKEISFPNIKIISAQIILATADWIVASLTLYALMPTGEIPYFILVKVFLVSQLLGIISQVPGGMGVFETAIVFLLPHAAENPAVMGGLLAYRAIFYFFPLSIALFMLASYEFVRLSKKIDDKMRIFGKSISSVVVQILGASTFFAGMIALFSTSTPYSITQLRKIAENIPIWLLDLSHFLLSTTAAILLFVSRGLQLRIKSSYRLSCFLVGTVIILLIMTAQSFFVLMAFLILFVALLLSKKYYYREVSLINTTFSPWWFAVIGGVFVVSGWIGFFVNKHNIFSLFQFGTFMENMFSPSDASRFLRAVLGIGIVLAFVAVERTIKMFFRKPVVLDSKDIKNITDKSDYSYAFNALSGDKSFFSDEEKQSFVMYAPVRDNWIVLGDPVGKNEEISELLWKFKEITDHETVKPAFIGIDEKNIQIYDDIGLDVFNIGKEAEVVLETLMKDKNVVRYLDSLFKEAAEEGYEYEIVPPEKFEEYKDVYEYINAEWVKNSNYLQRKFIPGDYEPEYMKAMNFGVVKKDKKICAFSVIAATKNGYEASSGVVRHLPCSFNVFEYIICQNMLWALSKGYKRFSLGLTYILSADDNNGDVLKMFSKMYMFAEHFDDINKAKEFKDKFNPVWKNKYFAIHPDKYIIMFIRNFTALITPASVGKKKKKIFFRRSFLK